jgi:hypothetical protein
MIENGVKPVNKSVISVIIKLDEKIDYPFLIKFLKQEKLKINNIELNSIVITKRFEDGLHIPQNVLKIIKEIHCKLVFEFKQIN